MNWTYEQQYRWLTPWSRRRWPAAPPRCLLGVSLLACLTLDSATSALILCRYLTPIKELNSCTSASEASLEKKPPSLCISRNPFPEPSDPRRFSSSYISALHLETGTPYQGTSQPSRCLFANKTILRICSGSSIVCISRESLRTTTFVTFVNLGNFHVFLIFELILSRSFSSGLGSVSSVICETGKFG